MEALELAAVGFIRGNSNEKIKLFQLRHNSTLWSGVGGVEHQELANTTLLLRLFTLAW